MPDLNTIEFSRKKSRRVIQKLLLERGVALVCCTPCREKSLQKQYLAILKEPLILARTHQKQLLSQSRSNVHPLGKKFFIEPRNGSYTMPFVRTATEWLFV